MFLKILFSFAFFLSCRYGSSVDEPIIVSNESLSYSFIKETAIPFFREMIVLKQETCKPPQVHLPFGLPNKERNGQKDYCEEKNEPFFILPIIQMMQTHPLNRSP